MKKIEHDAVSFRDNAGSIFYFENKVLRILETEGEKRINFLLEKKILDNPEIDKYLISSKITKDYDLQINNSKKKNCN